MEKVHYHNTTDAPVYIGGVAIAPGSARLVDPRLVPGYAAKVETPPPGDPLLDVLDGSVPAVVERLASVSAAGLDQLEVAEKNGKTRKGVLTGITEERLRRATLEPTEQQLAELPSASDEELQELEELTSAFGAPKVLAVIVAERERRAAEGDAS